MSRISAAALVQHLWPNYVKFYMCSICSSDRHSIELLDIYWIMLESAFIHDLRHNYLWIMMAIVSDTLVWKLNELKRQRNPVLNSETLQISLEIVTGTDRSHRIGVDQL